MPSAQPKSSADPESCGVPVQNGADVSRKSWTVEPASAVPRTAGVVSLVTVAGTTESPVGAAGPTVSIVTVKAGLQALMLPATSVAVTRTAWATFGVRVPSGRPSASPKSAAVDVETGVPLQSVSTYTDTVEPASAVPRTVGAGSWVGVPGTRLEVARGCSVRRRRAGR